MLNLQEQLDELEYDLAVGFRDFENRWHRMTPNELAITNAYLNDLREQIKEVETKIEEVLSC